MLAPTLVDLSGSLNGGRMVQPHPLPAALAGKIFDRSEALECGITDAMLRSSRVVSVFRGLYRYPNTTVSYRDLVRAARRVLPDDATLSHVSCLALRGLDVAPRLPLHFATNQPIRTRRDQLVLHRHRGFLEPEHEAGVPILGPERTFVDCGTLVGLVMLVAIGDWLVAQGLTTVTKIRDFTVRSHLDGVQRARVASELIMTGVASVRESMLRAELVIRGLPQPEANGTIYDAEGRFIARSDLVYWRWRVVVEYDGWYHERDSAQRQYDVLRRERLEAAGWLVIIVTSKDMSKPSRVAWRVFQALTMRGYSGPTPRLDPRFGRWTATNLAGC